MSAPVLPRVWVVEDSALEAAAAVRALGPGVETRVFGEGAAMLEAVSRSSPPDVAILDWSLPDLSGLEVCQFLRSNSATAEIAILIVTGVHGRTEDVVQALAAGANDYVAKPYVAAELRARVGALLRSQQLRERAVRAEGALRSLIAHLPDPVIVLDASGIVNFVNPAASRAVGDPSLIGKPIAAVLPQLAAEDLSQVGALPLGDRVYAPASRKLSVSGEALTVITLRDITDERTQIAARDEFLAMLAHELRNPLAPLLTALEILKLRPDAETLDRSREIMERQVDRLSRLVDDLLDVSRITRGHIELRTDPVDLRAVLNRSVEVAQPLIDARQHRLALELPKDGLFVRGDAVRLEQLFTNLLNNAAKYTDVGGRLAVSAWRDGDEVVATVTDNGVGMKPDFLPRAFDLFAQANRGIDRSQGGLGLGLTLVRRIADLHAGSVSATSPGPGQGTTFTVRLPRTEAPVASAEPAPPKISAGHTPLRVLVVDDNEDAAELLASGLSMTGHDVTCAADGESALAMARELRPQVVLLDIGLPGMSGYEIARRMRKEAELSGCVLIAVTGYGQPSDRRASEKAGFDLHLVKPVHLDGLIDVLRQWAPSQREH